MVAKMVANNLIIGYNYAIYKPLWLKLKSACVE